MGAGGYIGAVAGAAAGAYAGSEMDGPDGDGTMTLVGGVIGGSLGMVLGSGAVTPGEMVQAASDARVAETVAEGIQERNERQMELDRLRVAAERETADKKAAEQRAIAERNQAEQNRRIAAANAQQQRIADVNAQNNASAAEQERIAQANAQRAREEEQRRAAEAERTRRAEAERARQVEAERAREAERKRLAEQRAAQEAERMRPVEFKEGIVLCTAPTNSNSRSWRCEGPLQTTYAVLDTPQGNVSLGEACGSSRSIRDLGMTGGFRAFGCGFGIHPTARDYPGNNDVPARHGVYVQDRGVFMCPRSTLAYCRGR
jgi:hypothetical protein